MLKIKTIICIALLCFSLIISNVGIATGGVETVTYHWSDYDTNIHWLSFPENMVDGSIDTYATEVFENVQQYNTVNNCSGVDLGVITKVEIRVYMGAMSGSGLDLRAEFRGSVSEWMPVAQPPVQPGWSPTVDVTDGTHGFSIPPLWFEIKDLMCYIRSGSGTLYQISKVELIVTYTPEPQVETAVRILGGVRILSGRFGGN